MKAFLAGIAEHLHREHGDAISELAVVLPNKRAGLFLKKYLSEVYQKAIWSPEILSVEEFMELLTGVTISEPLTLLFEFYRHYQEVEGEAAQGFDEFVRWAPTLINDLSEVDQYLVDGSALFRFVNEARAMEVWNTDGQPLTGTQERYLQLWQSLERYYTAFSEHLRARNLGHAGLVYRMAAERVEDLEETEFRTLSGKAWKHLYFIGFNSLNKAEEAVIRTLVQRGWASALWDADRYYLEHPQQEAGTFLRQYRQNWPEPFQWESDHLKTSEKQVRIYGVASNVGQAKAAGALLGDLPAEGEARETAIVLANESLLTPVLQSLPESVKHVNVTMGYPLSNTPLHSLVNTILILHENVRKLARNRHTAYRFYYKDVANVLNHPFLKNLEHSDQLSHALKQALQASNRVFVSRAELEAWVPENLHAAFAAMQPVFANWHDHPEQALDHLSALIGHFGRQLAARKPKGKPEKQLELEYLYQYAKAVKRLRTLAEEYGSIRDFATLKTVFQQIVGGQAMPFYGEPLSGLQVMGMLETRLLDFRNVLILSTNEDQLPASKTAPTFIPFDIRKEFGLPTHHERDAVYAYHFYRLLQRAENACLLYNTQPDDMGGGEKSRFITQLQYELPLANPKVTLTDRLITQPVQPEAFAEVRVEKNEAIMDRLHFLADRGISPSALNKFINCPLDFYYKYVIGLKDPPRVEETVEAISLGHFVHQVLEDFYRPFLGATLPVSAVRTMLDQVEECTEAAFLSRFSEAEIRSGKNRLTLHMAMRFIRKFLENELAFVESLAEKKQQLEILSLEQELYKELVVGGRTVKLFGLADRVDRIGNRTRIIDYKTGVVDKRDLKLYDLEEVATDGTKAKAFQLLVYALLYAEAHPEAMASLEAGIIALRKPSEGLLSLKVGKNGTLDGELLQAFAGKVQQVLAALLDPNQAFVHQEESAYCDFCAD